MLVLRTIAPEELPLLSVWVSVLLFPIHLLCSLLFLCRLHRRNLTFPYSMTRSQAETNAALLQVRAQVSEATVYPKGECNGIALYTWRRRRVPNGK